MIADLLPVRKFYMECTQAVHGRGVQSSQIAECISRDIERLLPSPFESQSDHAGQSYYSNGFLQLEVSGDELYIATNIATLCYHAFRFITDIFTFQSLYSKKVHLHLHFIPLYNLTISWKFRDEIRVSLILFTS